MVSEPSGLIIQDPSTEESQSQLLTLAVLLYDTGFNHDLIRPNYFADPITEKIVETVVDYMKEYGNPPTPETLEFLLVDTFRPEDDGMEYPVEVLEMALQTLRMVPKLPESDIEFFRRRALDYIKRQRLELALSQKNELVSVGDFRGLADLVSEAITVSNSDTISITSVLDESWCDKINERRESAILTGFPTLDTYLEGIGPGELCTVVAPPTGGKTRFLLSLAQSATQQGKDALFLSIEMASWKLCMRLAMRILGQSKESLSSDVDGLKQRLRELRQTVDSNVYIARFSPGVATLGDLKAFYTEYLKTHRKPGIILIDYADKLAPDRKQEKHYLDIEETYKAMFAWAGDADIPICTASQTNREGMDRTIITMKYIAAAIGKAAISDIVLTLTIDEEDPTITRCYIAKNRDGVSGKPVSLRIDPETQNLVEI